MRNTWRQTKNRAESWLEKYWRDFVFIHINKTAGSSIEKALGLRFGHVTASAKLDYIGVDRWRQKFSFAFVRNPWDRAVSHYHYRVKTDQSGLADNHLGFHDWLYEVYERKNPVYRDNEMMFMPQRQWLTDRGGNIIVSFVGRYESLHADFEKIRETIGRGDPLPHLKASNRGDYRQYYDRESAELVEKAFQQDIDEFGYTFD